MPYQVRVFCFIQYFCAETMPKAIEAVFMRHIPVILKFFKKACVIFLLPSMPFKNIRFVNLFLGIFFQMRNNLFKLYRFRSFKSVIFLFDERTSESFFLSAIVWELS